MKIHDISIPIHSLMPVYKNKDEKRPTIRATRTLSEGSNESYLGLESHTGTHADAPFHMLSTGARMDEVSLSTFMGDSLVVDATSFGEKISNVHLRKLPIKKGTIILFKTRKKPLTSFDFNFPYLSSSGASYLAKIGVKMVGIDQLGIERNSPNHDTHEILFKKNIGIVEGLELSKIKPGKYFFIGLPLKIVGGDGSPIRAVLVEGMK